MVKTLQILFFPSTPKFKNTVLCWCTAKCPRLFITLGESRKTPCSSNHMWHFATGDSQFEVGFLPFLWPNAATKMQKIASWEQAFVRVASGVYFEHAKPCNHNQVPISNTDGWIPLLFSPQPGVQPMYSVHVWRNSNDVSKCGRYWLLASLFQLQSPLQAGGSGEKKKTVIKSIGSLLHHFPTISHSDETAVWCNHLYIGFLQRRFRFPSHFTSAD